MRVLLVSVLIGLLPASAQTLSIGVLGGVHASSYRTDYSTPQSRIYLAGPTLQVGLPHGVTLEADALYSRLGTFEQVWHIGVSWTGSTRGDAWQVPLLVNYRLPFRSLHPYVLGGVDLRRVNGNTSSTTVSCWSGCQISNDRVTWYGKDHAWVLGGGVDTGFGHLRLSPEVRYLRWHVPADPWGDQLAAHFGTVPNEVQLMLGIRWRMKLK
jgi:hypothetical protein